VINIVHVVVWRIDPMCTIILFILSHSLLSKLFIVKNEEKEDDVMDNDSNANDNVERDAL
jgi:hypothetical protein